MPEPDTSPPVALITGAGRGIGRAAAVELAGAGYQLVLVSRNSTELAQTAALAGRGLVWPCDVRDPAAVQAAVDAAATAFGRLDGVIHCAGLAPVRSIAVMTDTEWRDVLDTNLSAAFYLCRAAWPVFQRQGGGVVVNISSAAARDPFAGFAAYAAAKAGLNLFGLSAAREGAAAGIRIHTIAPAATETAMFRQLMTPEQFSPDQTLDPADVARVVLQCVRGDLRHTGGEVIWLCKNPA